jgi:hypothetical protein
MIYLSDISSMNWRETRETKLSAEEVMEKILEIE